MEDWQARQNMLIGKTNTEKLKNSKVAVVGLGGVGGASVEALARAGVGNLLLIDGDTISESNRNRQLIATTETIGEAKTEAWKNRVRSINPVANVHTAYKMVGNGEDCGLLEFQPDYMIDAIDMISAKLFLIELCKTSNIPFISCMGTGNRLSASGFTVADIASTAGCPVARVLRKELKNRNIQGVPVLYNPTPTDASAVEEENGRHAPGSISYVPPVAGFMAAEYVIQKLIEK